MLYTSNLSTGVREVTFGRHRFEVIGPADAWAVKPGFHEKETYGWLDMLCKRGYRRPNDPTTVDRIGLDGWPVAFAGKSLCVDALFVFDDGCVPREGEWLNFFELHAKGRAGDKFEGVGPLAGFLLWSKWANGPILRFVIHKATMDASGAIIGKETVAKDVDLPLPALDVAHSLRVETEPNRVRIWWDDKLVLDHACAFGYGERPLYPQFRVYRNAQRRDARVKLKLLGCEG